MENTDSRITQVGFARFEGGSVYFVCLQFCLCPVWKFYHRQRSKTTVFCYFRLDNLLTLAVLAQQGKEKLIVVNHTMQSLHQSYFPCTTNCSNQLVTVHFGIHSIVELAQSFEVNVHCILVQQMPVCAVNRSERLTVWSSVFLLTLKEISTTAVIQTVVQVGYGYI